VHPQILSINVGSSSIKFALFEVVASSGLRVICKGTIEDVGSAPAFRAVDVHGDTVAERSWIDGAALSHRQLLDELLEWLANRPGQSRLVAAGHRVVHGGSRFSSPVLVNDHVLTELNRLVPLAPLHQPLNIAAIQAVKEAHPDLPQVACFDTAFHHHQAPVVTRFALPREFEAAGVRRYGFHGLSYEYIAGALATVAPDVALGRVIVAHLGAGASLCAMRGGRSVDTTMGFSALDGLPMSTRCGALDPGVVLYLLQSCNMNAGAVEELLYRRSGLLGISGVSGDMRALLDSADEHAGEAIDVFVFRACREIGALAASLGGLDALVFTAGIGEHAAAIRERICAGSVWLGVALDAAANEGGGPRITKASSRVAAFVIPTDEELMVARHTRSVVSA
jgi:acetate kinase